MDCFLDKKAKGKELFSFIFYFYNNNGYGSIFFKTIFIEVHQNGNRSAMPIHKVPEYTIWLKRFILADTLFMLGVRLIKVIYKSCLFWYVFFDSIFEFLFSLLCYKNYKLCDYLSLFYKRLLLHNKSYFFVNVQLFLFFVFL